MDLKDSVGLILGATALVISLYQAQKASQTLLAGIVIMFLDEYSSPEMRAALDSLEQFYTKEPELVRQLNSLFASCYDRNIISNECSELHALAEKYCTAHEDAIGKSRSKVAWFFNKAWRLHRHGFIDKRTLRTIYGLDGAKTFLKVACPLTLAIRFAKIHKGESRSYLKDPSVLWYKGAAAYIEDSASNRWIKLLKGQ